MVQRKRALWQGKWSSGTRQGCWELSPPQAKEMLGGKVRAGAAKEGPELELWSQREGVGERMPLPLLLPSSPPHPCLPLAHPEEKAEGRDSPLLRSWVSAL